MSVTIQIPTALRTYSDGKGVVEVSGSTVKEALDALTGAHAGLAHHLRNDAGALRSFVNVYLNDEDIRYLAKEATVVADGDTLTIVPSIAGGVWA